MSRFWQFTWNDYAEWVDGITWITWITKLMGDPSISLVAIQEELAPTTGRPHLQGYLEFRQRVRPIGRWRGIPRSIHWHQVRGSKVDRIRSMEYCLRLSKRTPGGLYFEKGCGALRALALPPHHRLRNAVHLEELRPWQTKIYQLFAEECEPMCRKIYWFWETKGGVGKSILAKAFVDNRDALVVMGKSSDVLNGVWNYLDKKKKGPDLIVWDIPRSVDEKYISYQALESLKNGLFFNSKYEAGMARIDTPHICCFANQPPDKTHLSEDRWVIKELVELEKFDLT